MLAATVREAAQRFSFRSALVAEPESNTRQLVLSFEDLDRLSNEVAAAMIARGVGDGDVVALVLPAIPEHYVCYAAAAKIGAITAAVNARLTPVERSALLSLVSPALIISVPELETSADVTVKPAISITDLLCNLRIEGGTPDHRAPNPTRDALIVFTSGTTGIPKAALFCEGAIDFITMTDVGAKWGDGGNALAGPALAHLGPMTKFEGALRRGTTQHLVKVWRAKDALTRMHALQVPVVAGVPTQLALMLRDRSFETFDSSCVKAIVVGGGPSSPALIKEARARFGAPVSTRYSCTEAGIGTGTALSDPEADCEETVGRPQPGVTLRIVNPTGLDLAQGEIGEVVLKSPANMARYFGDEKATKEALAVGGGVRTGDLGWIDTTGRLHLSGRKRERYVRGGFNVYPMEVEAVLADHPAVTAVAIIGRRDTVFGEMGTAFVVVRAGYEPPSLGDLRDFGADRLASYKLPDEVVIRDALPLTSMDKIDRRALEAELASSP